MDDETIKKQAEEFARIHRKEIAKELTDISRFAPEDIPVSIFMAGSPGAGKTEYSKSLIDIFGQTTIRIDGDEFRQRMPGYTGNNSQLFNTAVSLIVERVHDLALDNKQTFILDGTFSKYEKAASNIKRSLSKNRIVFIFYVYQKPDVAWKFTQAREVLEGRNIPKNAFIEQFINSRNTIEQIQNEFKGKVLVFLVKRNFETHEIEKVVALDDTTAQIDQYLEKRYTQSDLETLL